MLSQLKLQEFIKSLLCARVSVGNTTRDKTATAVTTVTKQFLLWSVRSDVKAM